MPDSMQVALRIGDQSLQRSISIMLAKDEMGQPLLDLMPSIRPALRRCGSYRLVSL